MIGGSGRQQSRAYAMQPLRVDCALHGTVAPTQFPEVSRPEHGGGRDRPHGPRPLCPWPSMWILTDSCGRASGVWTPANDHVFAAAGRYWCPKPAAGRANVIDFGGATG